jgi:hypothetical protein
MRRILLGAILLSVVGGVAYWHAHRNAAPLETAYVGGRNVTVYSSNAQVRESLQALNFGDKVEVLSRSGDSTQVRTPAGVEGWIVSRDLLPAELWQRIVALTAQAKTMPVQAWATTKALSNLRIEPGRDAARIYQIGRDTKVAILGRKVMDVPSATTGKESASTGEANSNGDEPETGEPATTKKEDWFLTLSDVKDAGQLAGWVVARFVQMDLPSPLPDYASSAGIRVGAWFELNRAADPSGGTRPQYILFGTRGPEGDVCDFTTMRAYTWSTKRERYETAYVESGFCGLMPVEVTPATETGGDATFRFENIKTSGKEDRVYRMHQTVIRRIDEQRHPTHAKPKKRGR